jgi:hypothetical protein
VSAGAGGARQNEQRDRKTPKAAESHQPAIAHAGVLQPVDIARMDIKTGPGGSGSFPIGATVECDYTDKKLSGKSPKFVCKIGEADEVKVKFGGANGEVYGEVAASRLLWALGFGADRMYPVRVVCRGCPQTPGSIERDKSQYILDPAVVERKFAAELPHDKGWSWKELDLVDEETGGATRAERDAFKLIAVFLQHTDSKQVQQRAVCLDDAEPKSAADCKRPFLMINDLGLTFGKASLFNDNAKSGVNYAAWSTMPIWKDDSDRNGASKCVGNLPKSFTGTLENPVISEEGRAFLANLLGQLSDQQIRDLFEVSRFNLRVRNPDDPRSGLATVDEWVSAFKKKRDEIANRRCA